MNLNLTTYIISIFDLHDNLKRRLNKDFIKMLDEQKELLEIKCNYGDKNLCKVEKKAWYASEILSASVEIYSYLANKY